MKDVNTIDTQFYLSNVSLKNMNVCSQERVFNSSSKVQDYSFVVGRCPCSAIKHMVNKCVESNIPYLIKLCDCDIAAAQRYMKNLNGWASILTEYDSGVRFFKDFAYNLDVTEDQLSSLIKKYDGRPPVRARRVRVVRCYEDGKMVEECENEL